MGVKEIFKKLTGATEKTDKKALKTRMTSRQDFSVGEMTKLLPDPDVILKKLNKKINVFQEIEQDPHVIACVGSRKAGVKSLELRIEQGEASDKVQEFIEDIFKQLPIHNIIGQILDAPLYGMQVLEVVWDCENNLWVPIEVEAKPLEWFKYDSENTLKYVTKEHRNGLELPPRKFLIVKHDARYNNPHGKKLLSSCFWPWTFKRGGLKFWFIFTEKFGMPFVVGKHPRGDSVDKTNELLELLSNLVQDGVIVIPDDASIDLKESPFKASSANIYEAIVSQCNAEISKALLGQTLSTENTGTGSYAATKGHLEVRSDIVDDDCKLVEQTLNQLIRWIVELNFSNEEAPEAKLYEEEQVDKTKAERDEILSRTGVAFSKKYYEKNYGLEEEDFEIAQPEIKEDSKDFSEFSASEKKTPQDLLDEFLENITAEEYHEQVKPMIEPVIKLVENCNDYQEVMEKIATAYEDMDDRQLSEKMAKALFVAELTGAKDV